jgi:lambda family phage portal protein
MTSANVLQHPATLRRAFESAGLHPALNAWIAAAIPADVDIHAALRALRARSREAAQNDDHMSFFLSLVETNLIGSRGINVQARPKLASGRDDPASAARFEDYWARQCERGTYDATGQLSRSDFDRLGVRTCAQDGEVLIRLHEFDPDSPTGFAVELIDAEALDLDYNDLLPNGNLVRMGVETTRRRRPVAYWLFEATPDAPSGYTSGYRAGRRVRLPARDIIHAYLPQWVWGTRGIPWAHTALRRLKMLGGYEEAAITAARCAAIKSAAYVTTPDYIPGSGPATSLGADGQFNQDLSPGGIEMVPQGWDLKTLDWTWPNTEHGVFVKAALRGIACGLGVSYNALANDLEGVNYSSLRQGALSEREIWMRLQDWWIEWVTKPIYRRALAHALRSGRLLRRNGDPYPLERLDSLTQVTAQGRRWPWVDPLKDMQSNRESVALGVRSISDIIRESGRDPEEVWAELGDDYRQMDAAGIPRPLLSPAAPPVTAPDAPADQPDTEDAP